MQSLEPTHDASADAESQSAGTTRIFLAMYWRSSCATQRRREISLKRATSKRSSWSPWGTYRVEVTWYLHPPLVVRRALRGPLLARRDNATTRQHNAMQCKGLGIAQRVPGQVLTSTSILSLSSWSLKTVSCRCFLRCSWYKSYASISSQTMVAHMVWHAPRASDCMTLECVWLVVHAMRARFSLGETPIQIVGPGCCSPRSGLPLTRARLVARPTI
jgi:hypothetical protein